MQIEVLKSKIHRATVTNADLNYIGSITIDEDLMDAAGIVANERVYIVDNNNGERIDTYAIAGPRGGGDICLNGAAARRVYPGDVVIITGDEHPVNAQLAGLRQNQQQLLHQSRRFRTKVGFTPAQPRGSPSPGAPHPQTAPV